MHNDRKSSSAIFEQIANHIGGVGKKWLCVNKGKKRCIIRTRTVSENLKRMKSQKTVGPNDKSIEILKCI